MNQRIKKLFGTDGIRAEVDSFPLDKNSLITLGRAIGYIYRGSNILFGRDTRESGIVLEKHIFEGLISYAEVCSVGVLATPILSFVTEKENFDLGIMITASHNPFNYNGIKFFKMNGEKISVEDESNIEEEFWKLQSKEIISISSKNNFPEKYDLDNKYTEYIANICKKNNLLDKKLLNMKVVVDCANGAFSFEAEKVFKILGFNKFVYINNKPNGTNINENCGALYIDNLVTKVIKEKAEMGIAFDGDGDRLICVDRTGFVLNGDYILFMISQYLSNKNKKNRNVVGTTMSNLGLEKALQNIGLKLIRSDVGDRNVYSKMNDNDALVGGEQSGHIIIGNNKTGDGLISFLFFLASVQDYDKSIEAIKDVIDEYPQILKNYEIKNKIPINEWSELKNMINEFENMYSDNSRIVVRYSGTEPLIRVMIESENRNIIDKNIKEFEKIIKDRNY